MSCVYILQSWRYDQKRQEHHIVYKIGKSKNSVLKRVGNATMSANDISTVAIIETPNGKENILEKLLHYHYEKIVRKIIGRSVKSEWFKLDLNHLKVFLSYVVKLTDYKIEWFNEANGQRHESKQNLTSKIRLRDNPTSRYLEYYNLAKKVFENNLKNSFKPIRQINNIKPTGTSGLN